MADTKMKGAMYAVAFLVYTGLVFQSANLMHSGHSRTITPSHLGQVSDAALPPIQQYQPPVRNVSAAPESLSQPASHSESGVVTFKNARDIHSSYSCYGRDYTKDHHRKLSCKFSEVCLVDGKIHHVVADAAELAYIKEAGISVDLSPSGIMKITSTPGPEYASTTQWTPEFIIREEFVKKAGGAEKQVKILPNMHVYYVSYNAENFGHFLSDELFPIYAILSAFGELSYDMQMVRQPAMLLYSCDYQGKHWGEVQQIKCDKNYARMTKMVSGNNVTVLHALAQEHAGEVVCMDRMVAGLGMLSDHCYDTTTHGRRKTDEGCNQGRQDTFWGFRQYTMRNLGIPLDLAEIRPKPKIIIWDRDIKDYKANRKIFKLPELKAEIEKRHDVEVLIFDFPHESVQNQVGNISESAIHITGPGSGSFIGWFLPRGATQIRIYPARDVEMLEWFVFNYLPYIQTEHVNCDGSGNFDQAKVLDLVAYALNRWQHR